MNIKKLLEELNAWAMMVGILAAVVLIVVAVAVLTDEMAHAGVM